jgi:glycosyltransferase involved in cell wall biosynthesis
VDRTVREREAIGLLWLIDSLALGGAEALAAEFARAHDRSRWRLTVAFLKSIGGNPIAAELAATGVEVVDLEARHLRDLGAFRRLRRLLAGHRIELVHAHLAYASIWGSFAAHLAGVPALATLHVLPGEVKWASREGLRRRLLVAALERWAWAAVAVSSAARAAWVEAGLTPGRVVVVPNGIDVERFGSAGPARARLRSELGWEPGETVVLTVAVLRPGKGIEDLLPALASVRERVPGIRLAVAGEGPERPRLEALARELGVAGRVTWLGFRRDIPELLAAADLFALASEVEAFPTVLLEAMAANRPLVATRTGGVVEIVTPGTGRLVEAGDVAALASALVELTTAPELARGLAVSARERVEREFSTSAWLGRLDEVYRRALGARAGTPRSGAAGRLA